MIYQRFFKVLVAITGTLLFSASLYAQQANKSPFDKVDPNQRLKQKGEQVIGNSLTLSPQQEIQVRDLISQELLQQQEMRDVKKEAGLIDFDENEILYLGANESLRGSAEGKYIIFNTSTNMYRYVDMEKYKKVVSFAELQKKSQLENKEEK